MASYMALANMNAAILGKIIRVRPSALYKRRKKSGTIRVSELRRMATFLSSPTEKLMG